LEGEGPKEASCRSGETCLSQNATSSRYIDVNKDLGVVDSLLLLWLAGYYFLQRNFVADITLMYSDVVNDTRAYNRS